MLSRERFARIYAHQEADRVPIIAEIDRLVPKLKEGSGYIFSSDHSIPNTVSLSTMEKIVARVKEKGSYQEKRKNVNKAAVAVPTTAAWIIFPGKRP